jgi:hypothetical protein
MALIPHTLRRGAVYYFRRSKSLSTGVSFRVIVSLRTACPRTARYRAALLNACFESFALRLFSNARTKATMSPDEARRVFQAELATAMRNLEEERAHAMMKPYDHGDFETFLTVHEEVYRFLADQPSGQAVDYEVWLDRVGHRGRDVVELGWNFIKETGSIFYQTLDDTADALEAQGISTNILFMSHGAQILFEARLAAILNYRKGMQDPAVRYALPLEHRSAPRLPMESAVDHGRQPADSASPPEPYASMDAVAAVECFVRENPKLSGSENGKRKANWVPKTRSQFDAAMRLLGKSIGKKPFWQLATADVQHLLAQFDGLPPN